MSTMGVPSGGIRPNSSFSICWERSCIFGLRWAMRCAVVSKL
jgi:hypothetical protein